MENLLMLRICPQLLLPLPLPTRTPNTLQETISLCQPVQRVVTLPHRPDESTQRVDLIFTCVPTVLVDFADADLDGGMVLRFYDTVCSAAFAGDITARLKCFSSIGIWMSIGRHVQIDEFATFILHFVLMTENMRCKRFGQIATRRWL